MRRALLVLAHPRSGSFNHAIAVRAAETCRALGLELRFHDLYTEGFDPVLRADEAWTAGQAAESVLAASADPLLATHRAAIGRSDALLVVHPNWWGKPPAILAGWLDRVLVPGIAYRLDSAGGAPEGLLHIRNLLVFTTSDTLAEREAAMFGDPLESLWGRCIAPYIGDPAFTRRVYRVVSESTPELRAQWLDDVSDTISQALG